MPARSADLGVAAAAHRRRGRRPYRARASFERDGYNKLVFNLLQMMDGLDKFVTVKDGDLIVRMHKDEAPVLQSTPCRSRTRR